MTLSYKTKSRCVADSSALLHVCPERLFDCVIAGRNNLPIAEIVDVSSITYNCCVGADGDPHTCHTTARSVGGSRIWNVCEGYRDLC